MIQVPEGRPSSHALSLALSDAHFRNVLTLDNHDDIPRKILSQPLECPTEILLQVAHILQPNI